MSHLERLVRVVDRVRPIGPEVQDLVPRGGDHPEQTFAQHVSGVVESAGDDHVATSVGDGALTRERILLAAAQEFSAKGLAGARVDVIAPRMRRREPEALACAKTVCHLPMRGAKTSLNVAVAFGIAAYELREVLE